MMRLTAEEVAMEVCHALSSGLPYSLIRLGDGEGRVIAWPNRISNAMLNRHLRYWFGRDDFSDLDRLGLKWGLGRSILEANCVGLPMEYHEEINTWWRIPVEWWQENEPEIGVCDHDVNLQMWDRGMLDEMWGASYERRLGLVTCRDVGPALADFLEIPDDRAYTVRVPEEGHTGRKGTDHWPDGFQRTVQQIMGLGNLRGELWLVGAGILGKTYCAIIKARGGVALDVGSLFDGWAGVVSRSYLSDGTKYCIV